MVQSFPQWRFKLEDQKTCIDGALVNDISETLLKIGMKAHKELGISAIEFAAILSYTGEELLKTVGFVQTGPIRIVQKFEGMQ